MSKIKLDALCAYLNEFLDAQSFKDYCPNGLQVEGKENIAKLAIGVSASLETIREAIEQDADALLVHHGMFWQRDPQPVVGVKKEKLHLLLENELSLIAFHLPLDAHRKCGNNWKAAIDLGWKDLQPFALFDGVFVGVKGKVDAINREAFVAQLEKYYGHKAHTALGGEKVINNVGLVSGGAYKVIHDAAEQNIDCFITGNFDEPVWHDAFELGINFCALGHSATERIGPMALGKHLEEKFAIECLFIDVFNPF